MHFVVCLPLNRIMFNEIGKLFATKFTFHSFNNEKWEKESFSFFSFLTIALEDK